MAGSTLSKRASSQEMGEAPSTGDAPDGLFDIGRSLRRSDFGVTAAVSIVFTVVATYLVFSRSGYYIELADQSLYLLMTDNPRASIRSASGYHVLLSPLFSLVDESIVDFRRLRAVLDIGVDVGLGLSLVRYLRSRGYSGLFDATPVVLTVIFTITLSGFASWIYAVNGFGYDQLGAMIFTLLITTLLWMLGGEASPSRDAILATIGGALFAMAVIVRWTAALASAALIVWVLVDHVGIRRTLTLLGAGLVGVIGALSVVHVAIIDLPVLVGGILSGTVDVGRDSHSLGVLLSEYGVWTLRGLASGIGLVLGSVCALMLLKARDRFDNSLVVGLVTAGAIMFAVQTVYGLPHEIEAMVVGTFLALVCGVLLLAQIRARGWASAASSGGVGLALPVTLAALPVLLAAGSFLPLFLTSLPLATLWVACLWMIIPEVESERLRTVALLVGAVLLSAMPLLVWQGFDTPARTFVADQPVLVERGRFEGLLVDQTTQQLFYDLEDLRVQLDPNPTVLSFWVRPAVPFALEGTGIGFPWYNVSRAPNAAAETISGACLDDGDIPTGDVVFVTEETNPVAFGPIRSALLDCEIDFPVGFDLVDTMVAPGNIELFVYIREGES